MLGFLELLILMILDLISPDQDDCDISIQPKKAVKIMAKIEAIL